MWSWSSLLLPPVFSKEEIKRTKERKRKIKEKQRRPDTFNWLKEWFKHFYVVAGTHGTVTGFFRDFWFQSSKTHPRLLI